MTKKTAATGHTAKHTTSTSKHTLAKKHSPAAKTKKTTTKKAAAVHTVAKPAAHAKARSLAIGDWLPVCSFEALAMSLRLLGQFVHDDEVGALWELAGALPLGASLAAALDAASLHGLAGLRPQGTCLGLEGPHAADHLPLPVAQYEATAVGPVEDLLPGDLHALILGIDRPGPHAVLATPDGWWSWGERYDPSAFPHAVIEEAWAVTWA